MASIESGQSLLDHQQEQEHQEQPEQPQPTPPAATTTTLQPQQEYFDQPIDLIIENKARIVPGKYSKSYDILLAGDANVGKTTFLGTFTSVGHVAATSSLFTQFHVMRYREPDSGIATQVRLRIMDGYNGTAKAFPSRLYPYLHGIVLAFDVTNKLSFEHISSCYQQEIEQFAVKDVALVLVGMKADQQTRLVSHEEGEELAAKLGEIPYLECSSMDGGGSVKNAMRVMLQRIVYTVRLPRPKRKRFEGASCSVL